jgi:hypothetical protein
LQWLWDKHLGLRGEMAERLGFEPCYPKKFPSMNEKQHIVRNQAFQGKDFHSEKIRPHQNFHV